MQLKRLIPPAALALTCGAALVIGAGAAPIRVSITKTDDNVVTSYVIKGDRSALYLNPNAGAPIGSPMPWSQIENVYWEEPEDWKAAWKLWTRRDYAAAEKAFEALVENYKNIEQVEDSYEAKAAYYHAECLRRTGQYAKLMPVFEKVKLVNLSKSYQRQIQLFNYWGHAGKKLWEPLELITDRFEMPATEIPPHTVPPNTPPLVKIEPELLVQIAYLRGLANEMNSREEHEAAVKLLDPQQPETAQAVALAWEDVKASLADYNRVFTLTYMSDRNLSKEAMERSMAILKEDPMIAKDYKTQMEAHAVAVFYKDLFGNGTVPSAFTSFLKEPEKPKGEWQHSDDDAAEGGDEAEAEAEAEAAEAEKPAEE